MRRSRTKRVRGMFILRTPYARQHCGASDHARAQVHPERAKARMNVVSSVRAATHDQHTGQTRGAVIVFSNIQTMRARCHEPVILDRWCRQDEGAVRGTIAE